MPLSVKNEFPIALARDGKTGRVRVIPDARRYRRVNAGVVAGRVLMIRRGPSRLKVEECPLVNLSYGGICFRTRKALKKHGTHRLLIEVKAPFQDTARTRVKIRWIRPLDSQEIIAGAVFVESNKGWLGPEEESEG